MDGVRTLAVAAAGAWKKVGSLPASAGHLVTVGKHIYAITNSGDLYRTGI